MTEDLEISQGSSNSDLGREALWFVLHTLIAIVTVVLTVLVIALFHPNPAASTPKLLGTLLAFLIPLAVGFAVTRHTNPIARYVWISGMLIFFAVCVWVVDLPTGQGLCNDCGPGHLLQRIWRTFFDFSNGSGLMGGDGVLVGLWVPLSLFGYALGARLSLDRR